MSRLPKQPEIPVASATFIINTPDDGFLSRMQDAPVLARWTIFYGGIRAWRREGHEHVTLLRARLDENGTLQGPPFEPGVPLEEIEMKDVLPKEITVVLLNGQNEEVRRIPLTRWIAFYTASQ